MSIIDRNKKVQEFLEQYFDQSSEPQTLSEDLKKDIEDVFKTTAWGFREILLVIVIAKYLNPDYKASSAFYQCNPRALYEGPIRTELLKHKIPHKKSGPLNVAKAALGINEQWAAQRRPAAIAEKIVTLVKYIEEADSQELLSFAGYLIWRFEKEASRVEALALETKPESDPKFLFNLTKEMIAKVPDGGNSPQKIVGLLLLSYHEDLQTGLKVAGYEDSASVTNTTSKKPGDITEELLDGTVAKVYEVTTKPFGNSRVEESFDALAQYSASSGTKIEEVIVICRREDVHPELVSEAEDTLYFGKLEYQNITYHFIDIFDWIMSQIIRMSVDARITFYLKLQEYISNPNTSEKVKLFWREYHNQ